MRCDEYGNDKIALLFSVYIRRADFIERAIEIVSGVNGGLLWKTERNEFEDSSEHCTATVSRNRRRV